MATPNLRPADPAAEATALEAFGIQPAKPVTPWRLAAQAKAEEIVALIKGHADPEVRYAIAREIAEDIQHEIKTALRREHGRVFDRLLDGPH